MKAFGEIGLRKSIKFALFTVLHLGFRALPLPQLRTVYLRVLGATVGKDCIIHNVRFFNYYRTGFTGLRIGNCCFLGDECLLDLAAPITLEDHVTLAERVLILTHVNVGYQDHPLQRVVTSSARPVVIRSGSFVAANATILDGVEIGPTSAIGACSLVKEAVPPQTLVAGVPARPVSSLRVNGGDGGNG